MKYCQFDGCINKINKGVYCSEHRRFRKSSKAKAKKKEIYHHENKPFYRTQDWRDTRAFVYEREKGCCQRCGRFVYGKQAHVHHIIPIKKDKSLRLETNNLMLLCPKCHSIIENEETNEKVFPNYFQ